MKPLSHIRLFLLDMDGTIYLGNKLFPWTIPFLETLKEKGIGYLFVTNNSSRSKSSYVDKLGRMGMDVAPEDILTSGDAAISHLHAAHAGKKVFLVGTKSLASAFANEGITLTEERKAEILVLGFDTELTYEKLRDLYRGVSSGKPYIATHPDLLCPVEDGYIPDIGAVIAYVEAATGRRPDLILGKPERYLLDAASARCGVPVSDMAMVGDRLYTDMAMAARHGAAGILVLSGESTKEDAERASIAPRYVVENLSGILPLL